MWMIKVVSSGASTDSMTASVPKVLVAFSSFM
jgi:hypothetical protein